MRDSPRVSHFHLYSRFMIDKSIVKSLVEEWLDGKEYFLVDVEISKDNKIVVEIDHADGVWIEDCVALKNDINSNVLM